MWDFKPWDNDSAADWFGDLMDTCKVRNEWLKGMNADIEDEPEVVRAAVALFVMLGRVYIWPIRNYDEDLELAISKLEELAKNDLMSEVDELIEEIKLETEELKSRRKKSPNSPQETSKPNKPWWRFW